MCTTRRLFTSGTVKSICGLTINTTFNQLSYFALRLHFSVDNTSGTDVFPSWTAGVY
jgi:hypothetical protein